MYSTERSGEQRPLGLVVAGKAAPGEIYFVGIPGAVSVIVKWVGHGLSVILCAYMPQVPKAGGPAACTHVPLGGPSFLLLRLSSRPVFFPRQVKCRQSIITKVFISWLLNRKHRHSKRQLLQGLQRRSWNVSQALATQVLSSQTFAPSRSLPSCPPRWRNRTLRQLST